MCRSVHVHSDLALHPYTTCILWGPALTVSFSLCSTFGSFSEQVTSYDNVSLFLFAWIITTWCSYSCCYVMTIKVIFWKYKLKSAKVHCKAWQIMTSHNRFLLHTFCSSTVSWGRAASHHLRSVGENPFLSTRSSPRVPKWSTLDGKWCQLLKYHRSFVSQVRSPH